MNSLITIHLSQIEAIILATMVKEASDQLMKQIDQLDQEQRQFLSMIQAIGKQLPVVE